MAITNNAKARKKLLIEQLIKRHTKFIDRMQARLAELDKEDEVKVEEAKSE